MKLDELPAAGEIVVGNPEQESAVEVFASNQRLDYFLSSWVPLGKAFIVDCGAAFSLGWLE